MATKTMAKPKANKTDLKALRLKLTAAYDGLVKEAATRLMPEDAARVASIMATCQELLGGGDQGDQNPTDQDGNEIVASFPCPDDLAAALMGAMGEAEAVMALLKGQEAAKTEDGEQYPASAFAYAPDPEQPAGWKLRLWEDPEKKITRAQLGRAAAALSPGGFRGNRVEIPAGDLPAVKRKIRSAYKALGVDDAEIPRWVKEAEERAIVADFVALTEAAIKDGKARVVVIKAGFNLGKGRYYPAEVLRRDFGIFEGVKMYADHPTADEDKQRPERSIRDFVAILSGVACDEAGTISGVATIVEPWLLQKLANLQDKGMLSQMGISINAVASASKAEVEGVKTMLVERLIAARSVDFVTEAGAGGMVLALEACNSFDIDLVGLEELKGRRPDLIQALETEAKSEALKEARKAMDGEQKIKDLETQLAALTTERDGLKAAKEAADKLQAQAACKAAVDTALAASSLPDAAKSRISERYAGAVKADGLTEAIKAEADYIALITESAKVKNLGNAPPADEDKTSLKEAFMAAGMSEKAATIAATGR
jgi:hypothetical protein